MGDPCTEPLWTQEGGAGRPTLLLHGLGASAHYWDAVTARLARRRWLAPDLLGFGRSPAPPDAVYDLNCHLTALAPLVADGTTVVGHSTGAVLAAALAAAHPDRVRGVLLVGLPVFPDAEAARAEIGRIGLLARLTVEGRPAGRVLCELMCRVRPVAIAAAPLLVRDMPRVVAGDAARHTWTSYSRTLHNLVVAHRVQGDLEQLSVPVVFLHGQGDRTAPTARVEELARRLDQQRRAVSLRVVPGDHHLPVRRPGLVARAIEDLE